MNGQPNNSVWGKGFLWGAAMASHQVEGGCTNDWSRWEASEERLKALDRRGELGRHGRENYLSGASVDHWNRYREDIGIAASLGLNALRISVEWSRIEPSEGVFSEEALQHYVDVVHEMRSKGIEPVVTLWHWTLPIWLADKGGWESASTIAAFERFTEKVVSTIGSEVRFWVTLNEPEIYTTHAYWMGVWPPQKDGFFASLWVVRNLLAGHRAAYRVIKRLQPGKVSQRLPHPPAQGQSPRNDGGYVDPSVRWDDRVSGSMVGIAKNNIWFEAVDDKLWNRIVAGVGRFFWNDLILDLTDHTTDFVGINQYFHNRVDGWFHENTDEKKSDMGWGLSPEALYHVLMEAKVFKKPIIVTENGLADAADAQRGWFLKESIEQMKRAQHNGADVRGYLHWSLLDNFEWDKGYWPQFGLVAVDRGTMKRTVRGSARVYGEIIKRG